MEVIILKEIIKIIQLSIKKIYIYDLNINLTNFINLDNNEIIKIYGEDKNINYSEIYSFLLKNNAKITEIEIKK